MISLGAGRWECRDCGDKFLCEKGEKPIATITAHSGMKERVISSDGKEVHRCSKADAG